MSCFTILYYYYLPTYSSSAALSEIEWERMDGWSSPDVNLLKNQITNNLWIMGRRLDHILYSGYWCAKVGENNQNNVYK